MRIKSRLQRILMSRQGRTTQNLTRMEANATKIFLVLTDCEVSKMKKLFVRLDELTALADVFQEHYFA